MRTKYYVGLLSILLTACGGDQTDPDDPLAPTTNPTTNPTTSPQTMPYIKTQIALGSITVAMVKMVAQATWPTWAKT